MTYDPALAPISPIPSVAERRPTGVVIAALTLGVASLGALVTAGFFAMVAVVVPRSPQLLAARTQQLPQGAVQPSMAAIVVVYILMALVALGLAIWGAATVVGLLRLKPWARVSIMIQGGLVAVAAGFFALGSLMVPMMIGSMALPANVSQAQLRIVFACMALIAGTIALVGIWWIVYFALRGAREAFSPSARSLHGIAAAQRMAQPAPPRQVGPITDFTVAQPLPPTQDSEPKL